MPTKYGTAHIGRRAAENALHAIRYASLRGTPINTHVTINFATLGIDDDKAGVLFRKLQLSLGRWWRYQRKKKGRNLGAPVGVHAHANPAGSRHVHWLMHVPPEFRTECIAALNKRLCKLTGLDDVGTALHIQEVNRPGGIAKYVLRGIDPAYAEYLHINAANEGSVSCRRTGTSRAIGKAARENAGWNRKRNSLDANGGI